MAIDNVASIAVSDATFDSVFGKTIPLLIGKCVVTGSTIWSNSDTFTKTTTIQGTVTTTGVTFAVAFGKPDPSATKSYISRLWINGALSYDATGKSPVTFTGLTVTTYDGDEAQLADPIMAANIGTTCPAFRGLIYAVIAGVDFTYLTNIPAVIAEITQTNDTTYKVSSFVGGIAGAQSVYALVDDVASTVSFFYANAAGIDVFDIGTQTLLYHLPCSISTNDKYAVAALPNSRIVVMDNVNYFLHTIDMVTGNVLGSSASFMPTSSATTPFDDTALVASDDGSFLFGCDGNYYAEPILIKMNGNVPTFFKSWPRTDGQKGAYINMKPAPVGPFPTCVANASFVQRLLTTLTQEVVTGLIIEGKDYSCPPFQRPIYAATFNAPNGARTAAMQNLPGLVYRLATSPTLIETVPTAVVTASDPTTFFGALDTSKFQVFYSVNNGATEVWRLIATGGAMVAVAAIPSQVPASYAIRYAIRYAQSQDSGQPPGDVIYQDENLYLQLTDPAQDASPVIKPLADPELGEGSFGGYTMYVANEPQIVREAQDELALLYSVGANELIMELVTGPETNPYVGLIVYNTVTRATVYRKFDTFYSRQLTLSVDGGQFDANYYLAEGADTQNAAGQTVYQPMVLVNPPMRDAVFNHFSPYTDVAILAWPIASIYNAMGGLNHLENVKPARYGDDILTYCNNGTFAVLNMNTGIQTTKDISNFVLAATGAQVDPSALPPDLTYDADSGLVFSPSSPIAFYLNSGVAVGDTTLGAVLQSLCLFCGYTADQINVQNVTPIDVQGCVINQSVSLTSLLAAVAQVFSIDVFDTDNAINFVRKARGTALQFDLEITEDDLMPVSETTNEHMLDYVRAFSGDLPTTQTLEYIDGPNYGTVGTQTAKRTTFPAKTTAADQTVDTSVPIIMTSAAAIYWVNAMLFDKWAAALKTSFRLAPSAFAVDPGDYIQLTRDSGTIEAIRVSSATLNKDRSISIEGTSIIQYNDFVGVGSQAPTISVSSLVKTTPPVPGIFTNVLFLLADDTASTVPLRFISDQACGLQNYIGTAYQTVAGASRAATCGVLISAMRPAYATGSLPYTEVDNASAIMLRFRSAQALPSTMTQDAFYGGQCFALIGQPGAWELIYYRTATAIDKAGLVWSLTGLLRGRRGTEVLCQRSTAGDLALLPPSIDAMPLLGLPLTAIGAGVAVRLLAAGGAGQATALTIQPGASHGPWAPCNLTCVRTASASQAGLFDLAFAWNRRTRDETDTIHDGDAIVRNEFGTEAYTLTVQVGNAVVHKEAALSSASFTYTAELQQADSLAATPTAFALLVSQIGNGVTGPAGANSFSY